MASMTDVIFLLLIFFMITSTVVSPNAIKVLLPQGKQQTSAKPLYTRIQKKKKEAFYASFLFSFYLFLKHFLDFLTETFFLLFCFFRFFGSLGCTVCCRTVAACSIKSLQSFLCLLIKVGRSLDYQCYIVITTNVLVT